MANSVAGYRARRGTAVVFTAVTLAMLTGFAALAIDVGYMYAAQADLQKGADAAALAGANVLPDKTAAVAEALDYTAQNLPGQGMVLALSDVAIRPRGRGFKRSRKRTKQPLGRIANAASPSMPCPGTLQYWDAAQND